jgi:hypothetical protein
MHLTSSGSTWHWIKPVLGHGDQLPALRKAFAYSYLGWSEDQGKSILFLDYSRLCVWSPNNKEKIWRHLHGSSHWAYDHWTSRLSESLRFCQSMWSVPLIIESLIFLDNTAPCLQRLYKLEKVIYKILKIGWLGFVVFFITMM